MTYTSTGTLRRNVITLDEDIAALGRRRIGEDCRVRVSFEPLPKAEEESRRDSRRLLAEINEALADAPDPEEQQLRDRMMRRLRRRDHEW